MPGAAAVHRSGEGRKRGERMLEEEVLVSGFLMSYSVI